MALPFIAGLALGALGVVAYKNREIIKATIKNIINNKIFFLTLLFYIQN